MNNLTALAAHDQHEGEKMKDKPVRTAIRKLFKRYDVRGSADEWARLQLAVIQASVDGDVSEDEHGKILDAVDAFARALRSLPAKESAT